MMTNDEAAGTIHQLSASGGGVPKLPLDEAAVDERGITADQQADREHHGHWNQALCLWSLERIEALRDEGHTLYPGAAGENVTVAGLDWDRVTPGTRLRLGDGVLIEITGYTTPCWKNAQWFAGGDFNRMNQKTHPGWSRVYAQVLRGGTLRPGDAVALIEAEAGATPG